MDIDMDRNGDSLKIIIDGNIDATGGQKLAAALQEAMGMQGLKDVVFNLAMVRTISSSGIGKLMNFFKYIDGKKGAMRVKGISDQLYKQFLEIHLDRVFPVER